MGKRPKTKTLTGAAVGAILEVAEEEGEAPLAAVGSRGLSPAYRLTAGGISAGVLRAVADPVLIVPSIIAER